MISSFITNEYDHSLISCNIVQKSWVTPHSFIFSLEKGNVGAVNYSNMQACMKIQYIRQKLNLYSYNKFESHYLV